MPLLVRCAPDGVSSAPLAEAAACVRAGGLVAFPTETVYGIAVHAWDRQAVERLYKVKGRPRDKSLTVHLWDVAAAEAFARTISPSARRLMEALWPGPLTLVLPGRETPTVGVRVPDHAMARAFLALCRVPVVAPSANRSGEPPPTDAARVCATVGPELDAVIDGGPTMLRHPSTVVDATSEPVRILREGAISREQLRIVGVPLAQAT